MLDKKLNILGAMLGGAGLIKGAKAFNRKMDGKGSEYRPGTEVPAIEESLPNPDEELV